MPGGPSACSWARPSIGDWRELRRDATATHYHAATMALELHPKEAMGYAANLETGAPLVYVVLREGGDSGKPMTWPW